MLFFTGRQTIALAELPLSANPNTMRCSVLNIHGMFYTAEPTGAEELAAGGTTCVHLLPARIIACLQSVVLKEINKA